MYAIRSYYDLPFPLFPPSRGAHGPPLVTFVFRQAFLVALPEEVFFRGYLYDVFEERGWEPVTITSLLFAAGHLVIDASAYRALTFFPALLFGWGRKKSGNIYVPVFLHRITSYNVCYTKLLRFQGASIFVCMASMTD